MNVWIPKSKDEQCILKMLISMSTATLMHVGPTKKAFISQLRFVADMLEKDENKEQP